MTPIALDDPHALVACNVALKLPEAVYVTVGAISVEAEAGTPPANVQLYAVIGRLQPLTVPVGTPPVPTQTLLGVVTVTTGTVFTVITSVSSKTPHAFVMRKRIVYVPTLVRLN